MYSVILAQAMGYLIRELALYFIPIFGQSISATWQHLVTLFLVVAYLDIGIMVLFFFLNVAVACTLQSSSIAVVRLSASTIPMWSFKSISVIYMSGFFSYSIIK